jgi:benzoyl-CoA reductase/2-hydroxyglutaryl-CoA dehydratase subunit BcrC/BadD/HgdB
MNSFESLLHSLLLDPMSAPRELKARGGRAIGYFGRDVPVELILAANALPLRLYGRADAPTPHADRFLEPAFSAQIRSIAEQWFSGEFDCLEAVIFPRSSDNAQRLYYYLCELQRRGKCGGPRPLIYDIASIRRDSSRAHTAAATQILASQIGVDPGKLVESVQAVERRVALRAQLNSLRLQARAPAGSFAWRALRASDAAWGNAEFETQLGDWVRAPVTHGPTRRILLAGNAPPDARIHLAVEAAGGNVVREVDEEGTHLLQSREPGSEHSLQSIAARCYEAASLPQQFMLSADVLTAHARAVKADGVVTWMVQEEEALVWELPGQLRALADARIPVLVLTHQKWAAGADTCAEIARFLQPLGSS